MSQTVFKTVILTIFLAGGCLAQSQNGQRPVRERLGENSISAPETDRLIVRHRRDADSAAVDSTLAQHGARLLSQNEALGISVIRLGGDPRRNRKALEETGLFDYVEEDGVATSLAAPDDPNFPAAWHLMQIQAPGAWNITTGSAGVTIAIIDSGVDSTHPDLAGKVVGGWSFLKGSTDTSDVYGHGTKTAGSAAASTNNGVGVAGVAWNNPIMPLVVLNSNNYAYYSHIASAITYAADRGVRIINVSIGGTSASSTLQNAVNYAWNKGAVVFASAGNYGSSSLFYPAACDKVVAVGSTNSYDSLSSFSNYGSWVDVVAPGENIWTTTSGGGYAPVSGTSFSSPITAGVAALVLSQNPSMTAQDLVSAITNNTDDLGPAGFDSTYGWGRVNANKAVAAVNGSLIPAPDTIPPTTTISSPGNGAGVSSIVSIQGSASDNKGVTRIEFLVDGVVRGSATSSPFIFSWDSRTSGNGNHSLTVRGFDAAGNQGQTSITVSVNNVTADTAAPSVIISTPGNGALATNAISVQGTASDNIAISRIELLVDGVLKSTLYSSPYNFTWDSKTVANGTRILTVRAFDTSGNAGQSSVTVNVSNFAVPVSDTQAPLVEIVSPEDQSSPGTLVKISASATDANGVSQIAIYVDGVLLGTGNGGSFTINWNTKKAGRGWHDIWAKAWDDAGNVGSSQVVSVYVK